MNVGSLFTGIGGFDLGLERAGMRVLWQCESDPYCQRILARHWPTVPCHPDVVGLHPTPVDVLCGGFPCQDISYAGRGAGIDGTRSGLWAEYARLIRELRPRYVIVENVPALLARGMGRVLGDLAALGYDAEWDCLPASAFGAPHRRDRVWIVAHPNGQGEHDGAVDAEMGGAPQPVANPNGQGPQGHRRPELRPRERPAAPSGVLGDTDNGGWDGRPRILGPRRRGEPAHPGRWEPEPDVGRVAHGIPHRVDRLRALGNSLVPQIAEWIGRRILEAEVI